MNITQLLSLTVIQFFELLKIIIGKVSLAANISLETSMSGFVIATKKNVEWSRS